jgi:hypothetical protein
MATNDMAKNFLAATSKSVKLLGKNPKMPAPRNDITKLFQAIDKARDATNKARNALADQIQDYDNALDAVKNDLVSYKQQLAKADFGLDVKKPEDKKKIVAVQKIMDDACGDVLDNLIDLHKVVDDLDKALEQDIK